MKLKELLRGIEILSATADMETEIGDISYDSRAAVKPGDLFCAIVGAATDGHRFIPMAMEKGAAAVLCETPPENGVPYVRVRDSRLALALASRNFFGDPAGGMTVVGVTGTNGKTTTTLLLKHVLEETLGAKVGLIGTNANMIGERELPTERTTPQSCELQKLFRAMADAGCTHVVMEVSSHALDQDRVAGVRYAVGVFTNLTQDHLDYHKTMENYAAAKAKLFSVSDAAIVNLDDPWAEYFLRTARAAGCSVTGCSIGNAGADIAARELRLLPDRVEFSAECGGARQTVRLGIPGRFSVYNAMSVLAAARALGIPLPDAVAALETAKGVKGRVELIPTDGDYTILIDYAHTPDALENVLKTVRETAPGRVVAVFGCGGDRDRTKRPIMGKLAADLADFVVVTSDNPRTEDPEAIIAEILAGVTADRGKYTAITDRAAAIEYAIEHHRSGDVIVLAGKGHETYQEVGHVKRHMDEREIVAEILNKRRERL